MQLELLLEYLKAIDWWGYLKQAISGLADQIAAGLESLAGTPIPENLQWLPQEVAATVIITAIFILISMSKQVVKAVVIILWIIAIIGIIALLFA